MELAHGSIRLRDAAADDAAQLAKWWNDGAVMAHAGFPNGLGTTPERIAADLAMAMEARCYRGGRGRTRMNAIKFGKNDVFAGVLLVLLIAILIFYRRFI